MTNAIMKVLSSIICLSLALLSGALVAAPVKIIFDTDMIGDYDDVGAMAVLHKLADAGECEILATVSSTHSNASVGTIEIINRYYGRPEIPVGAVKNDGVGGGSENPQRRSHVKYEKLLQMYPDWWRYRNANESPDATDVYRQVLAAQADGSVTVVTTGFLTNLRKLLQSAPDALSPLDGRALVKAKVRALYVMGGKAPKGREFNFFNDPASADFVFREWPTRLIVNDFWFGTYIYAGRKVTALPAGNPVRDIYAMCLPSAEKCPPAAEIIPTGRFKDNVKEGHNCFDQSCVLAAVRGSGSFFRLKRGRMEMVGDKGDNVWKPDPDGPHELMAFIPDWPRERIASVIDDLMAAPPKTDVAEIVAARTADEKARGAGKRGWIAYEAERNQYFPAQNLARVKEIAAMLPARAELPSDPIRHRSEWDRLATTDEGRSMIAKARVALTNAIPALTIEEFRAYQRTGDRSTYGKPMGVRNKMLTDLLWGETLENRGAFTDKIAAVLEATCDEPSWVAPFEGGMSDVTKPLHGVTHYIDLSASARASLVATSLSWLRDRIPEPTKERVLDTLRGRIFETFLKDARRKGETTPYCNWWMPDRFNWSAFCHNGCTTAILAVEDDPTVRAEAIEASERLMVPCFLSGFLADGYCEEGMGYWNYGFGNFLRLAATVKVQTGGVVDFCKAFPRAKVVAGFGAKYRMGHGSSPLFADGNGTAAKDVLSLINMNWSEMYRAEVQDLPVFANGDMAVFGVRNFGRFKFVAPPREKLAPLPLRDWFENAETLICRKGGLAFAIKGGWNGDRHNHNDAGSYLIDIADREVTGDPGNENYTSRTFSRRRYESKVLNSYAHPVPRVGGELQGTGPAFGAKVLKTDFTEDRDTIVYDLAPAYPAKVPIVKLVRTAVFDRKAGEITVADEVEFAEPTAFETPVIAWRKPIPGKDRAHFRLSNGAGEELEVSVGVRGGEWDLSEEFIPNPARTQPTRVAIALRQPVLKATIGVRYRLVTGRARVDAPVTAPEGAKCLCALDLSEATCGAGRRPQKCRNCEGKPLSIAGQAFARGVGVHAPFEWKVFANGGLERFVANVGIDDDMKDAKSASVVFQVLADGRTVVDTGVLRAGDRHAIDADLRGAKWVTLKVTDAGDGLACDHADWAEAAFVPVPGKTWGEAALRELSPQMGVLTPPVRPEPRINGARLFGVRPGHPVLWRIPVSGERPMSVEIRGLPEGVVYDEGTRSLAGATAARGDHDFLVTAKNAKGVATRKLTLRVGDTLCLTPPMGWNSWNCWGQEVSDARMRQAADAMVETGLAEHGWNYIVVDDCWRTRPTEKEAGFKRPDWIGEKPHMYGPARLPDGTPATNAQFPDMKAMADYIHSKGLRAGLYSVPAEVACCYTFGSWQHEAKDAETWAKWGYDLVKYDWCYGDRQYGVEGGSKRDWQFKAYKLMGDLLAKQPRDIVYNVCNYGLCDVTEWARAAGGHYWRTNNDVKDSWKLLITSIDWNMKVAYAAGPGGWNDPDMLVIGPMRSNGFTKSRLTPNEQYTHMSLWAIQSAPLFIGCDMAQLAKDPLAWSFLTNDEVIDIDQDELGKVGRPVAHTDAFDVWARPLANGDWAVALFNRTREPREIAAEFAAVGASGTVIVRDVWAQKDLGLFSDRFAVEVYGHATRLFRLRRVAEADRRDGCAKCE